MDKQGNQTEKQASQMQDASSIMQEIRERVEADVAKNGRLRHSFKPKTPNFGGKKIKAGELGASEELRFLNLNFAIPTTPDLSHIVSHRKGFLGKLIVKLKRKAFSFVWQLFVPYFQKEQEFRSQSVRFLNSVGRYVDSRDADNFWDIIRKIDYDVNKALEQNDRIADEQSGQLVTVQKTLGDDLRENVQQLQAYITNLQSGQEENSQAIRTVDSVARGLEGLVAKLTSREADSAFQGQSSRNDGDSAESAPDYSYVLLENRFRGSEEEISKRLEVYLPDFKSAAKPVLEIGCGRGELLQLFTEQGIPSYGVDIDAAMIERCQEQNLSVELIDAIAYLKTQEDDSLGGIIAVQVVEHLERVYLEELAELAGRKVVAGGKIIFETINPQSLLALSSNYFRDPTHVWPLHPDTLRYQMELKGLKVNDVRYLSPVSGVLKSVPVDEQMPPRWKTTIDLFNNNIEQLNGLLYGHMDYAIIAEPRKG